MPTLRLTKAAIDALPVGLKDQVFWDEHLKGFGVKVTPAGRKVFIVLYRTAGGVQRKYTIGPYGRVTPHLARIEAQKILAARLEGRDPAREKREARRRHTVDRIENVVDLFAAQHLASRRSGAELTRVLKREVAGPWAGRSLHEIRKRDVVELVSGIVGRGSPGTANKTFKAVRALFNWCVGQALLERSPCEAVRLPAQEAARERVLSDEELGAVLAAARRIGGAYGGIVELLALTAQRREEVARIAWAEVDLAGRLWTLPGSRTKNGRSHLVHLSDPAIAVLEHMPRSGEHVFVQGAKPFRDFARGKAELDRLSGVTGWRLHDLRRTAVSGMARLGVAPHVADKILNHRTGAISGVAAVYQRHEFMAERKVALERWGEHVSSLNPTLR